MIIIENYALGGGGPPPAEVRGVLASASPRRAADMQMQCSICPIIYIYIYIHHIYW